MRIFSKKLPHPDLVSNLVNIMIPTTVFHLKKNKQNPSMAVVACRNLESRKRYKF